MGEQKTRVLSSAEAARLFTRKPKIVGDKVVFYCDNGHRVVAPIDQAGKRGTCSKCGTPLTVPHAEAEAEPTDVTTILAGSKPAAPQVAAGPESAVGGVVAGNVPPFAPLRVESAERLVGGMPEPLHGELSAEEIGGDHTAATEETEVDSPLPAVAGESVSAGWTFMSPAEPSGDATGAHADWPDAGAADAGDEEGLDNPTARLVARLWVEHELGGTLELHLQDGSVVFPQSYEPRWSRGTHGLFAAAAPDGTITLTAVAWESVQKIIVRNVKGLPDGMFE